MLWRFESDIGNVLRGFGCIQREGVEAIRVCTLGVLLRKLSQGDLGAYTGRVLRHFGCVGQRDRPVPGTMNGKVVLSPAQEPRGRILKRRIKTDDSMK